MTRHHRRLRLFAQLGLLLLLAIAGQGTIEATRAERDDLTDVWRRARLSGAYGFDARLVQTTAPLATVPNAGRRPRSTSLHMQGAVDLPRERMELTLWSQGGSVLAPESGLQLRVEDGRSLARSGKGPWQELETFSSDLFAPTGDFMAYLSAAKQVSIQPDGPGLTRYAFEVDGRAFATYMRERMTEQLAARGELPQGLQLGLDEALVDMTGHGELWVGADGLPVRQRLDLDLPDRPDDNGVSVQVDVSFTGFAPLPTPWLPGRAGDALALAARDGLLGELGLLLIVALTIASVAAILRRRGRLDRAYPMLVIAVVASMLLSPLLTRHQVSAFGRRQAARAAAMERDNATAESRAEALRAAHSPRLDPLADPLAGVQNARVLAQTNSDDGIVSSFSKYLFSICTTDPDTDTDGDGLTNLEECLVGTMPDHPDSDGDMLTDGEEVKGWSLDDGTGGSRTWYGDPLLADTNNDGITDSVEWVAAASLDTPYDTDGDHVPDAWDRDNDGDGVPDDLDLSPYFSTVGTNTFQGDRPFQLVVDDLTAGEHVKVEFQLRPTNPDHLWYTGNVLDWDDDDRQGQIQDTDGVTFFDLDNTLDPAPNAYGDVRLVPMMEIEITGQTDNLPSEQELKALGISVAQVSPDTKKAYVPLTLVADEVGDQNVAFHGRMYYLADDSWGNAQSLRLVWLVQALVDVCTAYEDGECSEYDSNQMNVEQIIHVYDDPWHLTGLNVTEEQGAEIALVHEDPSVADDAPLYMDTLHGLLYGLDVTYLAGADCASPQACVGSVDEIARRFDRGTNSGVSDESRWNLPNELRVATGSYELVELMTLQTMVTGTLAVLEEHFTDRWTVAEPITPTVLFAWEQTSRTIGLDASVGGNANLSWSGQQLTVDLPVGGSNAVEAQTTRTLAWAPYAYDNATGWHAADLATYTAQLPDHLAADFASENADQEQADIAWEQMLYMAAANGVNQVVHYGDHSTAADYETSDKPLAASMAGHAGALTKKAINLFFEDSPMINVFVQGGEWVDVEPWVSEFVPANRLATAQEWASARYEALLKSLGSKTAVAAAVFLVLAVAAITIVAMLSGHGPVGTAIRTTAAVAVGLLGLYFNVIKPIRSVLSWAQKLSELLEDVDMAVSRGEAIMEVLTSSSELTNQSRVAGVIGLVVTIGIAVGIFIWAIATGRVAVGSIDFNNLLAMTIATIIWAIVLFVLALTVVGAIIVGIITLIDLILTILGIPSISEKVDQAIASVIYQFQMTVKTPDIQIGDVTMGLTSEDAGIVAGNTIRYTMPLTTTIQQKKGLRAPDNDVSENSMVYALDTQLAETIGLSAAKGQRSDDYFDVAQYDTYSYHVGEELVPGALYQGTFTDTLSIEVDLQAGVNASNPFFLDTAYALIGIDCWVGVCVKKRTISGSSSTQVGNTIVLDVLPADLDTFVDGAWADGRLRIADADGDGLLPQWSGGADPDDSTPDADGDGLSDPYELSLRAAARAEGGRVVDPLSADTDGDGLTDAEEVRAGTNPDNDDTDDDGLLDGEELAPDGGWDLPYGPGKTTRAWSSPLDPDGDIDGLSDLFELTQDTCPSCAPWEDADNPLVYHPNVPNQSPVPLYVDDNLAEGFVAPGETFVYTTTTSNNLSGDSALVGELSVDLPTGFQGGPVSAEVDIHTGGSESLVSTLRAPTDGVDAVLSSTMDLTEFTDSRWDWESGDTSSFTPLGEVQQMVATRAWGWMQPHFVATIELETGTYYLRAYLVDPEGVVSEQGTVASLDASAWTLEDAPDVVCTRDGHCLIVWKQLELGANTRSVHMAHLSGTLASASVTQVFTSLPDNQQASPTVASDGSDFFMVWQAHSSDHKLQMWTLPVSGSGTMTTQPQLVDTTFRFPGNPPMTADVEWGGEAFGGDYVVINPQGNMLRYSEVTSEGVASEWIDFAIGFANSMAFDPLSKQLMVSYIEGTWFDAELRAIRLSAGGVSAPTVLSTTNVQTGLGDDGVTTRVKADPENGGWLVAWSAPYTKYASYQAVAADGTLRGDKGTLPTSETNPRIALSCEVPTPALSLELDDPSGTTTFTDDSGNDHHASCAANACPEAGSSGRFDQGVYFDGGDALTTSLAQPGAPFSTELWFKTSCQTCPILDRSGSRAGIALSSGNLCATVTKYVSGQDVADQICTSGTNYADDTWVHVVHVGAINHHKLYVNGVRETQSGAIGFVTCTTADCDDLVLGQANGAYYTGFLDRVRYYSRALSASEVNDVFASPELVLDLDQPAGATIFADSTGNAFDATCTGSGCPKAGVDGQSYTALHFDGQNDLLEITGQHTEVAYYYDFESGVDPAWNKQLTDSATRNGQKTTFAGPLLDDTLRLTLRNLPTHNTLDIDFDLFVLGDWDGNRTDSGPDWWQWSLDGDIQLKTTFSNGSSDPGNYQLYPSEYWTPSGVTLYKDSNPTASTVRQTFTEDASTLVGTTIGNDTTSWVEIFADTVAILYEDAGFSGSAWMMDPKRGVLDSYTNDKVSSLRVWPSTHSPRHGAAGDSLSAAVASPGSLYHLSEDVAGHTSTTAVLDFAASGVTGNELWGLDNVRVAAVSKDVSVPLTNKSMTLSAWVKRDNSVRTDPVITQGSGSSDASLYFGFNNAGWFSCGFGDGDLKAPQGDTQTYWHLWTCTFDSSSQTATIYRDGQMLSQAQLGSSYLGTGPTYIGSRQYLSKAYFSGTIDEVGIWSEALSEVEVAELYAKRKIDDQSIVQCQIPTAVHSQGIDLTRLTLRETTTRHGSVTQTLTHTVGVDSDSPTAALTAPANLGYVKAGHLIVSGTADDPTSYVTQVEVKQNTVDWQVATGTETWVWDAGSLPNGVHTFHARATDAVGNLGAASTSVVLVDGQAPTVTLDPVSGTLAPPRDTQGRWTVPLSGTVTDGAIGSFPGSGVAEVEVLLQGADGVEGNGWQTATVSGDSWSIDYALAPGSPKGRKKGFAPDGTATVQVRAADRVGNLAEPALLMQADQTLASPSASASAVITIDAEGPDVALTSLGDDTTSISTALTLGGQITDTSAVDTVEIAFKPAAQIGALDGSVLYLPLQDTNAGEYFADQSGRSLAATCEGSACPEIAAADDLIEAAAHFDDDDDELAIEGVDIAGSSFTVATWAKRDAAGNTDFLLSLGTTQRDQGLHFGFRATDLFTCAFWGDDLNTTDAYTDTDWHHWACTYDETTRTRTIYRDGKQVAQDTASADYTGRGTAYIGSYYEQSGTFFGGLIAQVTVHDRALAAWEVANLKGNGQTDWIAATSSGSQNPTWSYTIPEGDGGLEGLFQIVVRATDAQGNRTGLGDQRVWRGEIDTKPPDVTLSIKKNSLLGTVFSTTYTCNATDFDLDAADACASVPSSAPPTFGNNDKTLTDYGSHDAWYGSNITDTTRLWKVHATKTYQGSTSGSSTVKACDTNGRCSSVSTSALSLVASAADRPAQGRELLALVLDPAAGTVLTRTETISVSGVAGASEGLAALAVRVNGREAYARDWSTSGVTTTHFGFSWSPPAPGAYTFEPYVRDQLGNTVTETLASTIFVDTAAPVVSIAPTVLTSTHQVAFRTVELAGLVADEAGLHAVDVRVDGGPWQWAAHQRDAWTLPWRVIGPVDGRDFAVTVRASDVAGRVVTATEALRVDVSPPRPGGVSLRYTDAQGGSHALAPGSTLTDAASLELAWEAAEDGSRVVAYDAGWTTSRSPDPASLTRYGASGSHVQAAGEGRTWYAHLRLVDGLGNVHVETLGPVHVDGPTTPDAVGDLSYVGWLGSGCTLQGVDRRWTEASGAPDEAQSQRAYVTWDETALRLHWRGANWDHDGDLFVYVDSRNGGADTLFDPYGAAGDTTVLLPGNLPPAAAFAGARQTAAGDAFPGAAPAMRADHVIWVEDGSTASLWTWDGATWQEAGPISDGQLRFRKGVASSTTDLLVPFDGLGIVDPAASGLQLLALATEEDSLRIWSTMPSLNPVTSPRIVRSMPPGTRDGIVGLIRRLFLPYVSGRDDGPSPLEAAAAAQDSPRHIVLARAYVWDRLGDGQCPNGRTGGPAGPTGGPFADSDLRLRLSAEPVSTSYGLQRDGLFWWWDALFGRADAPAATSELFGFLDNDHPPLGPDQTLTYTLHYENLGSEPAVDVEALVLSWFSLILPEGQPSQDGLADQQVVPLGSIAAGERGSITIGARVDAAGAGEARFQRCRQSRSILDCAAQRTWSALDVRVYDAQTPRGSASPIDWLWSDHEVDSAAPDRPVIESPRPEALIGRMPVTVSGRAHDASGVQRIDLEVRAPDGDVVGVVCPEPGPTFGRWSCTWEPAGLQDGARYALRARAADRFGQTSDWTAWVPVEVDLSEPSVSIGPGISGRTLGAGHYSLSGEAIDDREIATVEVCEAESCTELRVSPSDAVDWPAEGHWSHPLLIPSRPDLDGESRLLSVYSRDAAGNRSTKAMTVSFEVDVVAPRLQVAEVVDNVVALADTAIATGTITDGTEIALYVRVRGPDGSQRRLQIDHGGSRWALAPAWRQPGEYRYWLEAVDGGGNRAMSGPYALQVTPAPAIYLPILVRRF